MTDITQALIDEYYQQTFINKNPMLGARALEKLRQHLPEKKFASLNELDTATKEINALLAEEEPRKGDKYDEQTLEKFEQLADNKKIPADVRLKMYDMLMAGQLRYFNDHANYIGIAKKKLEVINKNDYNTFHSVYVDASRYLHWVGYELRNSFIDSLRTKSPKNSSYIAPSAIAENDKWRKQKKNEKTQTALQQIHIIDEQLKDPSLPNIQRINLLQKKEKLYNGNGFSRTKIFSAKQDIYRQMRTAYLSLGDYENANRCLDSIKSFENSLRILQNQSYHH